RLGEVAAELRQMIYGEQGLPEWGTTFALAAATRGQDRRMSGLERSEAGNRPDAGVARRRRHPKTRNSQGRNRRRQNRSSSMQLRFAEVEIVVSACAAIPVSRIP
ncbi:MAG: hypothetical protein ACE5KM_08040, partial [Planctomycetaceae bacterium]